MKKQCDPAEPSFVDWRPYARDQPQGLTSQRIQPFPALQSRSDFKNRHGLAIELPDVFNAECHRTLVLHDPTRWNVWAQSARA